jgi:predicted GNAT family acetyltransferase
MNKKKRKQHENLYEAFKKYAVQTNSIEDFCNKYHSHVAYLDRGKGYMKYDLQSHIKEFKENGYSIIPQGSSTTGDIIAYYGNQEQNRIS